MKRALFAALASTLLAHPANAAELEGPEQHVEELKGAQDGAYDAHELRQVRDSESDARECRGNHAGQSANHADNPQLAAILERRRCTLFDEVAKERRAAYEQRRRIANQQERHGTRR